VQPIEFVGGSLEKADLDLAEKRYQKVLTKRSEMQSEERGRGK